MKKQPDISSLAEKWLKGTITEAEKQQLEDWYNSQPGHAVYWEKNETEDELKQRIFQSVVTQPETEQPVIRRISRARKLSVAATILLVAGGAAFYLFSKQGGPENQYLPANTHQAAISPTSKTTTLTLANGTVVPVDSIRNGLLAQQGSATVRTLPDGQLVYENGGEEEADMWNTLTVPRGGRITSIVLADGSKVWLNAQSTLRYPVAFGGNRKVEITGEGYFEVSKNAAKQFEVNAEGVTTQVLGTHFNVNSYEKQQGILVTLLEGAVKINTPANAQLLRPGQQADAATAGPIRLHKTPDLEAVMAWKKDLIKLNNSDIYTVMGQLARWYDVDVQIEKGMEGRRFSGLISRNTDLATVLNMLSMTKEVSFKHEGNNIIVSPYH